MPHTTYPHMNPIHTTYSRITNETGAGRMPAPPFPGAMLALVLITIVPLAAQATADEEAEAPAAQAAAVTGKIEATPSRNVTPEDFPSYIEAVASVLSIRNRASDPFAQIQDPDAKPVVKPKIASPARIAPIQATPFEDVVNLIRVTTVMPAERTFLIGTRQIREGDRLPITFRGRNIQIEVASVNSRRIEFRNLDSEETASLSLNLLPAGMSTGKEEISAPGMVPDNPNAPINLDAASIPLNAAHNR